MLRLCYRHLFCGHLFFFKYVFWFICFSLGTTTQTTLVILKGDF